MSSISKIHHAVINRPLAKLGGDAYLAGNVTLLVSGGVGSAWNQVAGAAAFMAAGLMYSRRGDRDGWFAAACGVCIPAMAVTNIHELATAATATIIGTGVYTAGQTLGVASKQLTQNFREAGNNLVRRTLGAPRKWMGTLCLGSKAFMVMDAVAQHNWSFLSVLGLWSAGDIGVGLSSAKTSAAKSPKQSTLVP